MEGTGVGYPEHKRIGMMQGRGTSTPTLCPMQALRVTGSHEAPGNRGCLGASNSHVTSTKHALQCMIALP
jgi:hypothetical protein